MRIHLFAVFSAAALAVLGGDFTFKVATDHEDALYRCGETATFTVTALDEGGKPAAAGEVEAKLDDWGRISIAAETFDLAKGNPFSIKGKLDAPGFLRLRLKEAKKKVKETVWGVGYEPERIRKGSPSPDDFDEFWAETMKRLDATTSPEPTIVRIPEKCSREFDFFRISFNTFEGRRVSGMLTIPTDKSKSRNGRFPVRFSVPSAGVGAWTFTLRGEPAAICMMMTVHTTFETPFSLEGVAECHKRNAKMLKEKYDCPYYAVAGLDKSREDYYFYPAIAGINRAVNWLAARPDVDLSDFTYAGGSQGGGFGFALLGLNRHFTRAVLRVPALTDIMGRLAGRTSGWPRYDGHFRDDRLAAADKNAPYFDGANFASRITCPTRVVVGFADTTCPPCAVYAAYNNIASKDKKIYNAIGMGHGKRSIYYGLLEKWQRGGDDSKSCIRK